MLARLEAGQARLYTRNGNHWTDKLPGLPAEFAGLQLETAWLDGEAVVLGPDGVPDFNALQNAFDSAREQTIVYYVFDCLSLNGRDLRGRAQAERTAALEQLLAGFSGPRVRRSEPITADGAAALQSACAMGLEDLIAKRLDGVYESKRSNCWRKLKCNLRQDFVVGGFTDRGGARPEVGSLLLGV